MAAAAAVSEGIAFHPERKQDIRAVVSAMSTPLRPEDRTTVVFPVPPYSPLPYLPQMLGNSIGRLLELSPLAIMYLGRFTNLLLWAGCIYLALSLLPDFGWALLLLAMTPTSLFLAASLSPDALTSGLCFVFVTLVCHHATRDSGFIAGRQVAMLILLAGCLGLAKPGYVGLIALLTIIPPHRLRWRYGRWLTTIAGGAVAMFTAIAWWWLNNQLSPPQVLDGRSAPGQIAYMRTIRCVFFWSTLAN